MQEGESIYQQPDRRQNSNENQNENRDQRAQPRSEPIYAQDMREPYQGYAPDGNARDYRQSERYQEYERGYNNGYEVPYADPQWPYRADGEKLRPQSSPRSRNGRLWLWLLGIVLIGVLLFGGASSFWYSHPDAHYFPMAKDERGYPQSKSAFDLKVADHAKIVINVNGSNVHIQVGTANLVSLHSDEGGTGVDTLPGIKTTNSGDQVNIAGNPLNAGATNLDVTVPSDSSLEIHTLSGNADVNGVNGPVVFDSKSGSFTITGDRTDQGQISATTLSGNIDLNDISLGGQSNLSTVSGHIGVHGTLLPGHVTIGTTSGDVSVALLQDGPINVHAETTTGMVENDYGSNNGDSAPQLDIHTLSGNITVTKG